MQVEAIQNKGILLFLCECCNEGGEGNRALGKCTR